MEGKLSLREIYETMGLNKRSIWRTEIIGEEENWNPIRDTKESKIRGTQIIAIIIIRGKQILLELNDYYILYCD